MRKLCDYLTVGEAAEFLGVSEWTLRYWDRTGKLKTSHNPPSRYRLYRRSQLEELLRKIARSDEVSIHKNGNARHKSRSRGRPTRATTETEHDGRR